jgi:hypothetical protein
MDLPGFTSAWLRSSSSKAANTADFAKFPARVVVGSAKSMLQERREKKLLTQWIRKKLSKDSLHIFSLIRNVKTYMTDMICCCCKVGETKWALL